MRTTSAVTGMYDKGSGALVVSENVAVDVATGEPLSVAGSFTLDGRGGAFVDRIEGDPGNVIGLSLPLLRNLLAEMDISITQLWRK